MIKEFATDSPKMYVVEEFYIDTHRRSPRAPPVSLVRYNGFDELFHQQAVCDKVNPLIGRLAVSFFLANPEVFIGEFFKDIEGFNDDEFFNTCL